MIAKKKGEPKDYILKRERNLSKSEQTVFIIQSISTCDKLDIASESRGDFPKASRLSVEKGLIGWKNFKDDDNGLVEFSKTSHEDNINCLDVVDVYELSEAVLRENSLTEEEEKNSDSEGALSQAS